MAEADGEIRVGDVIIEVDGVDLTGKNAPGVKEILISHPNKPFFQFRLLRRSSAQREPQSL